MRNNDNPYEKPILVMFSISLIMSFIIIDAFWLHINFSIQ